MFDFDPPTKTISVQFVNNNQTNVFKAGFENKVHLVQIKVLFRESPPSVLVLVLQTSKKNCICVPMLFITVTEIQGPSGEDGTLGEGGEPGEQVTIISLLT